MKVRVDENTLDTKNIVTIIVLDTPQKNTPIIEIFCKGKRLTVIHSPNDSIRIS